MAHMRMLFRSWLRAVASIASFSALAMSSWGETIDVSVSIGDTQSGAVAGWVVNITANSYETLPFSVASSPGSTATATAKLKRGEIYTLTMECTAGTNDMDYKLTLDGHESAYSNKTQLLVVTDPNGILGDHYVHGPNPLDPQLYQVKLTVCKDESAFNLEVGEGTGSTPDPINLLTGDMYFSERDVAIDAPAIPLDFIRSYDSMNMTTGSLGQGWTHSYDWRCTITTNVILAEGSNQTVRGEQVSIRAPSGGTRAFLCMTNSGEYTMSMESRWQLSKTAGVYYMSDGQGLIHNFGTNGELAVISNLYGQSMTFSYTGSFPNRHLSQVQHSNGQTLTFGYTGDHLTSLTTPDAALSASYAYNAQGLLATSTLWIDGVGRSTVYDYNANRLMTTRTTADSTVQQFQYDPTNNRATNLVVGGVYYQHGVTYTSTGGARVTYQRSGTAQTYEYLYSTSQMLLAEIRGTNSVGGAAGVRYFYDSADNATNTVHYTTGSSNSFITLYDDVRNLTNISFAVDGTPSNGCSLGWSTNFAYPLLQTVSGPDGERAEFVYSTGLLTRAREYWQPDVYAETLLAYSNGLLSCVTNANGHWMKFGYDAAGRLRQLVPQVGPAFTMSNDVLGRVVRMSWQGASGTNIVSILRNGEGAVTQITYPLTNLIERFAYNSMGRLTNVVDVAGRSTALTYLPTGRLESKKRRLSSGAVLTNRVDYDTQMNTLRITDEKGRTVEAYALDIEDRPVVVTNLERQTLSVEYGLGRTIKSVQRFDGSSVSNIINTEGLVSESRYPGGTNTFSYGRSGGLKTAGNHLGAISLAYDLAQRVTNASGVGPNSNIRYALDGVGNATSVVSVAGVRTVSFDAGERLSNMVVAITGVAGTRTFNYAYDTNSGLPSRTVYTNTGLNVSYGFDAMDRLTNMVWRDAASNVVRSFAYGYNAAGMITNSTLADGSRREYAYDELDRLVGERRFSATGLVSDVAYGFDEVGNRMTKTNNGVGVSFSYSNGCNRLAGWQVSSTNGLAGLMKVELAGQSSETIGTHPELGARWVSNTLTAASAVPNVNGSYFNLPGLPLGSGSQNVVVAVGDVAGNVGVVTNGVIANPITNATYAHSVAGCLTNMSFTGPSGTKTVDMSWNGLYQLTDVRINGSVVEKYGYDAAGRRVFESDGPTTNWMVYDGAQVVADVNASGGLVRSYIWGPGIDNLLAMTVHTGATARTYYAIKDHLGSVHALVDETGAVVESYEYDSWGKVLEVRDSSGSLRTSDLGLPISSLGNRYLWQGREYSWKTGLYNFRLRWYDPITGRWLSNDPIGISGGLNQYVFCANSPVNFIDPWGLEKSPLKPIEIGQYVFQMFKGDVYHGGEHWHVKVKGALIGRVSKAGKILTGSVPRSALKKFFKGAGGMTLGLFLSPSNLGADDEEPRGNSGASECDEKSAGNSDWSNVPLSPAPEGFDDGDGMGWDVPILDFFLPSPETW